MEKTHPDDEVRIFPWAPEILITLDSMVLHAGSLLAARRVKTTAAAATPPSSVWNALSTDQKGITCMTAQMRTTRAVCKKSSLKIGWAIFCDNQKKSRTPHTATARMVMLCPKNLMAIFWGARALISAPNTSSWNPKMGLSARMPQFHNAVKVSVFGCRVPGFALTVQMVGSKRWTIFTNRNERSKETTLG